VSRTGSKVIHLDGDGLSQAQSSSLALVALSIRDNWISGSRACFHFSTVLLCSVNVQADDVLAILLSGTDFNIHLGKGGWDQGTGGDLNWDGHCACGKRVRHRLDCDLASTKWELTFDIGCGITLARCDLHSGCLDNGTEMGTCHFLINRTDASDGFSASSGDA